MSSSWTRQICMIQMSPNVSPETRHSCVRKSIVRMFLPPTILGTQEINQSHLKPTHICVLRTPPPHRSTSRSILIRIIQEDLCWHIEIKTQRAHYLHRDLINQSLHKILITLPKVGFWIRKTKGRNSKSLQAQNLACSSSNLRKSNRDPSLLMIISLLVQQRQIFLQGEDPISTLNRLSYALTLLKWHQVLRKVWCPQVICHLKLNHKGAFNLRWEYMRVGMLRIGLVHPGQVWSQGVYPPLTRVVERKSLNAQKSNIKMSRGIVRNHKVSRC